MYEYSIAAIRQMHKRGVEMSISGVPATPEMVIKLLKQNSKRMPRICYNEKGYISKVEYI